MVRWLVYYLHDRLNSNDIKLWKKWFVKTLIPSPLNVMEAYLEKIPSFNARKQKSFLFYITLVVSFQFLFISRRSKMCLAPNRGSSSAKRCHQPSVCRALPQKPPTVHSQPGVATTAMPAQLTGP